MNLKVLWLFSLKSLWYRRRLVLPVIFLISLNFTLALSFERIRFSLSQSFTGVISGVDLIVGAPTSPLNLILYTLFNMGSASNNVSFETYTQFSQLDSVEWALPISLGDSHKGYRVVGTDPKFFKLYRYRDMRSLDFTFGGGFSKPQEAVVGYEVAQKLNYSLGHKLVLSHGSLGRGVDGFTDHQDQPFTLVGILAPTGTPLDQSVLIRLQDLDQLHDIASTQSISAFMLKLKSKIETLKLQRQINTQDQEPLLAVIPTVALSEIWSALDFFENIFLLIGGLILLISGLALVFIFHFIFYSRQHEVHLLKVMGISDGLVGLFFSVEILCVLFVSLILSFVVDAYFFEQLSQMLLSSFGIWVSDLATWKALFLPLVLISLLALGLNFLMVQMSLKSRWMHDRE